MIHSTNLVDIAKVGKPHGLTGALIVQPIADQFSTLITSSTLYCARPNFNNQQKNITYHPYEPLYCDSLRAAGNKHLIIFKNAHSPESAKIFTHTLIAIPRESLPSPELDEYYWHDLIGCTLFSNHIPGTLTLLGTIDHLLETGANDVLVTQENLMIPFVSEYVVHINLSKKQIIIHWPWK